MKGQEQSGRLSKQHKESKGVESIFGKEAKSHDNVVGKLSKLVKKELELIYTNLNFRYRNGITKEEINNVLKGIDSELGETLFVDKACIRPDGGIIEVLDRYSRWRVVLVTEAKYQGKDLENIKKGILVGKNKDQDLMVAGNAIERSHKNISEIQNLMLGEEHFPYIIFLEGTNFLTKKINVERPDGRVVTLDYSSGSLNRIDRLTAANYGRAINTNLCENKFIKINNKRVMLQSASIYTTGDGSMWNEQDMLSIMLEVANTSIRIMSNDLNI